MTPEHELLEQEERQDPEQQREPYAVGTAGSGRLHCVRQQAEKGSAQQRAGRKADEARQELRAARAVQQQENDAASALNKPPSAVRATM
jgi:hypothetical protein